jgi:fatty-acyl-CoA synthase
MGKAAWVEGKTLGEVLRVTAEKHGALEAVVFPRRDVRWTWRELDEKVDEVARALVALGVQRGDHVGIWATNCPEWILIQFACSRAGAVLVNVNPAYRASELEYALAQADVTTLFLVERFRDARYFDMLESVRGALPKLKNAISLTSQASTSILEWSAFLALASLAGDGALDARAPRATDVANIQFTSGTTGFPKGAMLTHANLVLNAFHIGRSLAFTPDDRLCIPVPFYHCFGCVIGTLCCAITGAAMVVPAESFDPEATLEAIAHERCTAVHGVPTMFIAQLEHPRFAEFDLASLRTGIMAGSPCPIEVMRQVIDRMGARGMTIAYGQTESSPGITITDASDPIEPRVTTVGRAMPGVEVKIVAPGTLDGVPDGEAGELVCRGHNVMLGYYAKPVETAAAVSPDGWLRTGDLGVRTPDGRFKITGRIKDLIIRGGENVYPREVEEYLYTHPGIADVQIVGLPDTKLGEEVSAWIRLKDGASLTEDAVKDYCRGRIAHFKVPRYVVFVDAFPTTVTGKVQKYRLRELGIERYGLAAAAAVKTA